MIKKFFTENGTAVPAVTVDQMKEIDRIAMDETGPNLFQMMENAGRNLSELTIKKFSDQLASKNILVLAGTGGNGGGGLCAARHLSNRGFNVNLLISDKDKLKEAPAYQLHILKSTRAKLITYEQLKNEDPGLIIDALIGYSLSGEIRGIVSDLIKWADQQSALKISLDVPSGVDAETGSTSGYFIRPDATLTLALPKTGLLPEMTGKLYLGDIGIPAGLYANLGLNIPARVFSGSFIVPLGAR